MTLDEKEMIFLEGIFKSDSTRNNFDSIFRKKIEELNDLRTIKVIKERQDLSIEVIYAGRMIAIDLLDEFIKEIMVGG